mmetsp:Transcript_68478/g.222877  ORF Transcript_68478/g.222877 Transcript_68478/m.222877 type:complete len:231 (-) Transcript_68478:1157-1849(-)
MRLLLQHVAIGVQAGYGGSHQETAIGPRQVHLLGREGAHTEEAWEHGQHAVEAQGDALRQRPLGLRRALEPGLRAAAARDAGLPGPPTGRGGAELGESRSERRMALHTFEVEVGARRGGLQDRMPGAVKVHSDSFADSFHLGRVAKGVQHLLRRLPRQQASRVPGLLVDQPPGLGDAHAEIATLWAPRPRRRERRRRQRRLLVPQRVCQRSALGARGWRTCLGGARGADG